VTSHSVYETSPSTVAVPCAKESPRGRGARSRRTRLGRSLGETRGGTVPAFATTSFAPGAVFGSAAAFARLAHDPTRSATKRSGFRGTRRTTGWWCHRLQRITPSAPMGVPYFKGGQDVMLHALDRGRGPRRRRTCSDVLDVGHQRGLVGPIRPMPSRAGQSRRACRHWDLSWRGSRPEAGFHVLLATTTALGVEPSEALRDRMEPMGPTLVLPTKRSACCSVSSSMVCAAGR
jgi:hypothetical protein